jgi:hypothetical protein
MQWQEYGKDKVFRGTEEAFFHCPGQCKAPYSRKMGDSMFALSCLSAMSCRGIFIIGRSNTFFSDSEYNLVTWPISLFEHCRNILYKLMAEWA